MTSRRTIVLALPSQNHYPLPEEDPTFKQEHILLFIFSQKNLQNSI